MNLRLNSLALTATVFGIMALAACNKEQPPASPPPSPSKPAVSPPAATMPVHTPMPPVTPPTTAPITMKPTTVQPTTATGATTSTPPPGTPPHVTPPENPRIAVFAGLTAPKPVTWLWQQPTKQFSIAEYAVPGQNGSDQAHITVSKAGGSVEANIARWKGQFRGADGKPVEPKVKNLEADGMPITLVEFAGEYSGMSGTFTPDQLFLNAIVQTPGGQVFIRFVGPSATVEANREAYMGMVEGLKLAEAQK